MLLLFLVTISGVVASDVNDKITNSNDENLTVQSDTGLTVIEQSNDDDTNDEQIDGSNQRDTLSASLDEDVLGATGTFSQLKSKLSSSNTVDLDMDYENTDRQSTININGANKVIDGHGHYIDGKRYSSRIFSISNDGITIKNVIFKNAVGSSGSAIFSSYSLTLINCTFQDTESTGTPSSALQLGGNFKVHNIINCTFTNNKGLAQGGAIYVSGTNVVAIINGSSFNKNYLTSYNMGHGGGAIFSTSNAELRIYNSNFTENTVKGEGGAIRHSGTLYMEGCLFDRNFAKDGAALMGANEQTSNSIIHNSTFINNRVDRWGGALQERKSNIYNCKFINNTAADGTMNTAKSDPHGGAIYVRDYVNVYNSEFYNNSAIQGGAIAFEDRAWDSIISGCTFEENNATVLGGAIYIDTAATISILSSNFTKNFAPNGGAINIIYGRGGILIITQSHFTENWAINSGGAIFDNGAGLIEVSYSTFDKNTANEGGAIYSKKLDIKYSQFTQNSVSESGGAIYNYDSMSILDVLFESNSAKFGGAFYSPSVSAESLRAYNNNATDGGAMYMDGSSSPSDIKNSEFNNNNATNDGGAIYWNSANANLINTKFISNYAGHDAGALYWRKGIGKLSQSTFTSNNAVHDGGAIYWVANDGEIYSNSAFENNYAGYRGGAVYWMGDYGSISQSTFTNNIANAEGSSVYWGGVNGEVSLSNFKGTSNFALLYWHGLDGQITRNNFGNDKAIYVCGHATATLKSNVQNSTTYDNYSLYILGNVSLDGNVFHNTIHNNGLILTDTSVVVLNNETIITADKYYDVYSAVLDDNGNYIKLQYGLVNTFDSSEYAPTFNNTHYVFKSPYLQLGVHKVSANANFTGLSNNVVKSGVLMYMILDINVTIINYGEKVVINITVVNTTENGTSLLVINDNEYNVTITNGSGILELHNVAPGKYEITAYYGVFNQTIDSEFEYVIQLRNSTLNITANNIIAGQNLTITITTTNGTSGTVYVFVNSKMYILSLTNSTAQLNLTNVPGGVYPIYATYNGDLRFNPCYNNTILTVTKLNTTLPIIIRNNILVGETAVLTINATSNLTGTMTVYINGKKYVFTRAPVSIPLTNLTAGNYTVNVLYSGDNVYNSATNNITFIVRKHDIVPTITTQDIKVGDNETITVTVPNNAKGIVFLTVNGNNYYVKVNNTKAIFVLAGLPYGKYNVTATYQEDDIYYSNSTNATFKVDYVIIDPTVTYTVDDNLDVIVNVTVPSDANGDIIIEVNGKNYTSDIVKGRFSVQIKDLEGGSYPAKMYFANDTKYRAVNKTGTIILTKLTSTIHIDSEHIYVGDNATITVRVPGDAGGNVTIYINNENHTANVINGSATFNVLGLSYGSYTIVANYSGDRKYESDVEDDVLIVRKVDPSPFSNITADEIRVGEIAIFNITMPSDLTAKINLTVQNQTHVVNVTNGLGQINIPGLKYGLPVPVHVSFLGNEKYLGWEFDYEGFSVHRHSNYPINITATTNDTSANITVTLPSDANGKGNITIDNRVFNVTYVNGKANVTVDGLQSGQQYVVTAFFAGDDKYTAGAASRTLNSDKTLDYVFNATAKDITVGEIAYVHIILPNITNGTVTLHVPGRDAMSVYVNTTFVEGSYDFAVYDLKVGSYLCSVTYSGNDKYESSTRYGTIVVSKIDPSLKWDFNTTYVGQNLTIQITLPNDSNGTVNITINNTIYNATVVNGTAYVTVPGLAANTYHATLFYSGNEKYNTITQNLEVTILKVHDFQFELGVIDINVGDNETITIKLPADIDVDVLISIPDIDYENVIHLTNGTATLNVTGFKVGRHNVTASIKDSAKYIDYSVIRYFTVSAIEDYKFDLHDVKTVIVRDNLTFILELPLDATGNVTVFIFNQTFTTEVKNGNATVKVPTTAQGNYEFTISFEEEGKYVYKSQSGYAFVVKTDLVLNPIYNASVNVDEDITITFNLPSDATGNVSVTSRGVTYTQKLVNGSANVTIKGYPIASTYSPSISYTGDEKYNPATDIITITSHKVSDYNITVEVSNITVDQTELVNISIPSDATEDVLISGNFSDSTFSVKLTNGNATFTIPNLAAGTYFINVRYQGYQKYADKNVTKIFRVDKVVPPIAIDFVNNDTLIVNLPALANGFANITIGDNPPVQIDIINGVGSLNVSYLRPGKYSVNATFLGGARYLENSTNITITIPKIEDYILPITVKDITVGENVTITIVAPYNATGYMNITINGGGVIEVPIIEGVATYNATKLAVGNYTVVVSYANEEYVFKTNSSEFKVKKIETDMVIVSTGNSTNVTVDVTLTEGVTGNVTIMINKVPYNITNIDSNKISLTIPALPGEHDILVTYYGDENHTSVTKDSYVETQKIKDYTLLVDAFDTITVLDMNVITVTLPTGIEGEVHIYVNGRSYPLTRINSTTGIAKLTLPQLTSGNYNVTASFSNQLYDTIENTTNFTVVKVNTTIKVDVKNITKDLTEIINVSVNNSATGYVLININGVTFQADIDDGVATLTRSNINEGTYVVTVTYPGDNIFNSNSTTTNFTVTKIPVDITITGPESIVVGQQVNFEIETSRNITDLVTVKIGDKNYTAVIYNGKGNLLVTDLKTIGDYNVTVIYDGDGDYLPANDTTKINVTGKLPTTIKVNVTNITVGEAVTIYINLTGDVNGTVTIAMLGNPVQVKLVNGTGNYTYYNLTARDYHFTVGYFESEYYLPYDVSGDFTVFKKSAPITVEVTNATVGDVEVITVTLPTNATGNVLLSVNGSNYYSALKNGVAIFDVTGLPIGNHTAHITFRTDDNYLANETDVNITTAKRVLTINITSENVIVVGYPVVFNIKTSANITEVVIVKIINRDTNAEIISNHTFVENGNGTYIVYGLAAGNYTAKVIFPGNTQYDQVTNKTNFTVSGKKPTSMNASVANITLGEDAIIYVDVTGAPTGQVTLNIAGRPQTKDVIGGKVNFTVGNLSARDYHVTLTYIENDDYLRSNTTVDFTVYRKSSTIDMNVSNIKVGDHEIINVTVTKGATGIVLIDIAGVRIYAEINETTGIATATFDDLGVNTYNVTATYVGDDNYNGSSTNKSFNVTKLTTLINITSNPSYIINHPIVFTFVTSANITRVVIIEVGGQNYTSFIENGKGTYTINNLAPDTYRATVYLVNDDRYEDVWNYTDFTVTGKTAISMNASAANITLGEDAVIYVNVTGALTGRVTLNMAGNPQTKDVVDGKVNFTVSNLIARDYHVTLTYIENDDYLSNTTTVDFTVFRKAAPISATVTNATVGSVEYIDVHLPTEAVGTVLLTVNGSNYYSVASGGVARFNVTGLLVGNHTAYIKYEGDSNYLENETEVNITTTKLKTTIVIATDLEIIEGHPVTFTIETGDPLTEVVTIRIGTVTYTTFVENGKGNYTVYGLSPNVYTAYVNFAGNAQYDPVENHTGFTIRGKSPSSITVKVENITVDDAAIIYVNVTDGASGTVSIIVAGESHEITLNNSKGNLTIPRLPARDYHITAYYQGDDYYAQSNGTADFTVSKILTSIRFEVSDINVGQKAVIKVMLNETTDENITVHVNGVKYILNDYKTTLEVPNLPEGTIVVTAEYAGNDRLTRAFNETTFKVTKNTTSIRITTHNITAGQVEKIEIHLASDINSVLGVTVGNVSYAAVITNGFAKLDIENLASGNYNVTVVFYGDDRYVASTANSSFVVKHESNYLFTANATVDSDANVVIGITLPDDVSGEVNVEIDGKNYTGLVVNGKGSATIVNLPGKDYIGIVYFDGNDKYDPDTTTVEFTVTKVSPNMRLDYSSIYVGDDAVITVYVPDAATGNITITINNENKTEKVVNGTAKFIIPNLEHGLYPFIANYTGDGRYLAAQRSGELVVDKLSNHTIVITADDIHVGENATIYVILPADATGKVNITIDNRIFTTGELVNGKGNVTVPNLKQGTYEIVAEYFGDAKYGYIKDTQHMTVRKYENYPFNVTITNGTSVGQNITISVTLPDDVTENVTIMVDGDLKEVEIINGKGNLTVNVTSGGSHPVVVTYPGDDKYESAIIYTDLSSDKITSFPFTISGDTVEFGQTAYVGYYDLIPDSCANATVTVNVTGRQVVSIKVNINGTGYAPFPDLPIGIYNVTVTYSGNDKYASTVRYTTITVTKVSDYAMDVSVNKPSVGENITIEVKLPSDAGGVVNVTIVTLELGNKTYNATVINGTANFSIPTDELADGDYEAIVHYIGDDKYDEMTKIVPIDIVKVVDYVFDFDSFDIFVGQNETITVTLPGDVNTKLNITIGSNNYEIVITNGTGSRNITGLAYGSYDAEITFGNDKYDKRTRHTSFKVSKVEDYNWNMSYTKEIKVGQNATVEVNVPKDAAGNVTLLINNKTFTGEIKEGKAFVNATGLPEGVYQFTLRFVDDSGKYTTDSKIGVVVVSKTDIEIVPVYENITVGNDAVINVTMPEGAKGDVSLFIDGRTFVEPIGTDGKVSFTVPDLDADNHTFIIGYDGDDKYNGDVYTGVIKVDKQDDYEWDFSVADIKVGQGEVINITLPADATGSLIITVGDESYHRAANGNTTFVVLGLNNGTYTVTIQYQGNLKYSNKTITKEFTVTKNAVPISIEVIGDNVVVKLPEDATGEVNITIGNKSELVSIIKGTATLDISDVLPGDYTINATYAGDRKYFANSTTKPHEINPVVVYDMTVGAINITVGEKAVVTVTLPKDATGKLNITVGTRTEEVEIINGTATWEIPDLGIGDYEVFANYTGNAKYSNNSASTTFNVKGKDVTPDVVVEGNNTVIVKLPDNADGYVNITIGNETQKVKVENGRAVWNGTSLQPGDYDVKVEYLGDNTYAPANATIGINIAKWASAVDLNVSDIMEGSIEVITVEVTPGATGIVLITIGEEGYSRTLDGSSKATFNIAGLTPGMHEAVVTYIGDDKYLNSTNSKTFRVGEKQKPSIIITADTSIEIDNTLRFTVTTNSTSTEITVKVNGVTVELVDGKYVYHANVSGAFNITATVAENVNFTSASNETTFTVYKHASEIVKVNVPANILVVGDNAEIKVTFANNESGSVLIEIGGLNYTVPIEGKVATLNVVLPVGDYIAEAYYAGDSKYNNTQAQSVVFSVSGPMEITVGTNDGNSTPVTIKLPSNASGEVTVVINGTPYTAKAENGTATVLLNGSNPGVQNATLIFTPEGQTPIVQNTTIDIPKVSEYPLKVDVTNVDKENGTVTVKVQAPSDATGNATITVAGKTVPVTLDEKGTAVVTITDVPVGSHDIDVVYNGDDKYESKSNRTHVNMPINLPSINVVDHLVRGWNSQFDYEAVFTNEFGEVLVDTDVTFIVNGKTHTVKTESHGIARLSETLPVGEYTISSVNPVTGETVTKKLSIVPRLKYNKDLTMDFKDGSHWDVLVIGDDGKPVGAGEIIDIYVNTIHYVAKTDKDGFARLKINLNPASYHISAEYKNYKVKNNLKIKQTLKLVKKTVTVKKGKKLILKATLKWSNGKAIKGKVIKFKFKGKTYKAKTNKKGLAKVTIKAKVTKKLKKGKKYTYSAKYVTNTVKGKVKVKK